MKLKDLSYLVLDTETTGMDASKDQIVQIGVVWTDWRGVPTGQRYESLVACPIPIPPDASAVHHITDDMLVGAKDLKTALKEIDALAPYNALVAHNAPFDMGFIRPPSHLPVICTLKLAKKVWPLLDSYKNNYLRYFHKLDVPGAKGQMAHSALPDAMVTAAVFEHALKEVFKKAKTSPEEIELDEVLKWLEQPNDLSRKQIKFGKHRGHTWEAVAATDRSYLEWMISPKGMTDMDPDQKFTIMRLLGRA